MQPIRTLAELIHAVRNSLTLISSHAQYLVGKRPADAAEGEELRVIHEEAERAACLLSMVPQNLARAPVQDLEREGSGTVDQPRGAGGARHEKARR